MKGHDFNKSRTFTFYFENVNGLEEGSSLRWHGLKIGLVKSIEPVRQDIDLEPLPSKEIAEIGNIHLQEGKRLLTSSSIQDLVFAREKINQAQLEIGLARLATDQHHIHVRVLSEVNAFRKIRIVQS